MLTAIFPRIALIVCLAAPLAMAQIHPHFGVLAGVPITDTLNSSSSSSESLIGSSTSISSDNYNAETKRLLIGPTFRVDFAHGLGLEFDALYQRIDSDYSALNTSPGAFTQSFQQTTANRWQFPVLVQYEFGIRKAKLFVEAGPSLSHIAGTHFSATTTSSTPPSPTTLSGPGETGTTGGFTTGGGVDIQWSRMHLRPEFRYSRWFSAPAGIAVLALPFSAFVTAADFIPANSIQPNHNEVSFLLGLTF